MHEKPRNILLCRRKNKRMQLIELYNCLVQVNNIYNNRLGRISNQMCICFSTLDRRKLLINAKFVLNCQWNIDLNILQYNITRSNLIVPFLPPSVQREAKWWSELLLLFLSWHFLSLSILNWICRTELWSEIVLVSTYVNLYLSIRYQTEKDHSHLPVIPTGWSN